MLDDPALGILGYLWLIKLSATLFLLYSGWIPELEASRNIWSYDPQRYYFNALDLIDHHWDPDFINLNYKGILFYYGAFFYVLGHNPVVPALVNTLVSLIASLYLIRMGYEIKRDRGNRDWTLALVLLLPEMVWFDVMTSRETLLASLLVIVLLTAGRYLAQTSQLSLSRFFMVCGVSLVAIAAVRTPMALSAIVTIGLMLIMIRPPRGLRSRSKFFLIFLLILAAILIPVVNTHLRGYDFDAGRTLQRMTSASKSGALGPGRQWHQSSIGKLLLPDGVLQSVFFLPPRMVLYLAAPLPNMDATLDTLLSGRWFAWQDLLTLLSSVINLLIYPYVLASLIQSIQKRAENAAPLIFHISYWLTFVAIAAGNLIIHERYRVMATPLLWGCAWLGARTCPRVLVIKMAMLWYGLLGMAALFYIGYKWI